MKILTTLLFTFLLLSASAQVDTTVVDTVITDSMQIIEQYGEPVSPYDPHLTTVPIYTTQFEEFEPCFLTYVSYYPMWDSTQPPKDIIVHIGDYLDAFGILEHILPEGKYMVTLYLKNDINPLEKGELMLTHGYMVHKTNQ